MDGTAVRGVVTPDAVVLEFEIASVASRSLAQALDLIVRFGLLIALAILSGAFATFGSTPAIILAFVGIFLIVFGYPAIMETRWNGQTVGKRVFGLRVVTVEGAPVRFRHTSIRSLLQVVDCVLPPVRRVGHVRLVAQPAQSAIGRRLRRHHRVARAHRRGVPGSRVVPAGVGLRAVRPQPRRRRHHAGAVRRHSLVPASSVRVDARGTCLQLRAQIINAVATSMHHTPPQQVTPETFLVSVAAAYQLRQGGPPVPLPPWVPQWGRQAAPARMGG